MSAGDFSPTTPASRLGGFIILLIGLSLVSMTLNIIGLKLEAFSERMKESIVRSMSEIIDEDEGDDVEKQVRLSL